MKMRKKGACGFCRHPEFEVSSASDGRPSFRCTSCGHHWTCGHKGKKTLSGAKVCK